MAISITITFFFTPYLISSLGQTQYGIWALIFSIIAYMDLADAGMRQSLVRNVSKYLAVDDWNQVNQVVSSSARIYIVITVIIQAATFWIAFFLMDSFKIPEEYLTVSRAALLVIGTNQAFSFLTIPFSSLGPFHRFDIGSYFSIATKILQTLGMIVLLESGLGLFEMSLLILSLTIATRYGMYRVRKKKFPRVRFSFKDINKEKTRELMDYAVYSFLIVVMWIVIYQTDNIIIGRFISMDAVAVFSIGALLISQFRDIVGTIFVSVVPTISHFEADHNFGKIMVIYSRTTKYLYYASAYMTICTFFLGGPFVLLWVGKDFAMSIKILHLLIIPAAVFFPQLIAYSVLYGISRHKISLYILVLEGFSNIVLSLILVRYWGIVGVAVGTAIPQLIIYLAVFPIVFHRVLRADVSRFYKTAAASIVRSVMITAPAAFLITRYLKPDTWLNFFTGGTIITVIAAVGFYKFVLEPSDKKSLTDKLKGMLKGKVSG